MSRTRLLQVVVAGAALVAAGAIGTGVSSSAGAPSLDKVAWWWRAQTGAGPAAVPAPPTVPANGIEVAGGPDGATAIAAVHYTLPPGDGAPRLTLQVADGESDPSSPPVMAACPAGSAWDATVNGSWNSKPTVACQLGSVQGVVATDGKSWSFALAPLLHDGVIDVVITPGTVPGRPAGADGSVFKLDFAAPTAASLATTAGADTSTGDASAVDNSLATAPSGYSSDVGGSTFADSSALASAPFTPSLPPESQQLTATAPSLVQSTAANALPIPPAATKRDGAALAVLVLLAGMALAFRVNKSEVPAPRRLGPLASGHRPAVASSPAAAHPEVGGLGRFARPRIGAPPNL